MSEYTKGYYLKNKERIKQQVINWRKDNKERFLSYQRIKQKEYNINFPLRKRLRNIKQRCEYPNDKKYKYYGGKGIKCLLTMSDLKFLWERDKANLMKQPSIDRLNPSGDYTLENCQFIEMQVNRKK